MQRRLFISHTSKTPSASVRLDQLGKAFAAHRFDVIVDRDHLGPGDEWRREIYTWLGLCDVAVVLIAPRALDPANPWVAREATILMWRRALDPSFIVVPVLVDGVELGDLEQGPFRDLLLNEVQGEIITDDGSLKWMERLAGQLATKAAACAPAPVSALARPVAEQLRGLDPDVLREAAAIIDVPLGPWKPQADPPMQLAVQLLHLGLEGSFAALDHLAMCGLATERLKALIELIAPSWIDLCAAQCLAETAARREDRSALLLNADSEWAASMFIRRASARPPGLAWPHIPLAVPIDGGGIESLTQHLREALMLKLKISNDVLARDADQLLDLQLQRRMNERKPIFVVVQHSSGVMAYIEELQSRFPSLRFLVLGGADCPADEIEPGLKVIVPRLRPGEEIEARLNYVEAKNQLIGE